MSKDRGGRIKPHFPGSTSLTPRRKLGVQRQLAAKRYATDPIEDRSTGEKRPLLVGPFLVPLSLARFDVLNCDATKRRHFALEHCEATYHDTLTHDTVFELLLQHGLLWSCHRIALRKNQSFTLIRVSAAPSEAGIPCGSRPTLRRAFLEVQWWLRTCRPCVHMPYESGLLDAV
jgi:hypothetical protein